MPHLLIIAQERRTLSGLRDELIRNGFSCSITLYNGELTKQIIGHPPDLLMVELNGRMPDSETGQMIKKIKQSTSLPLIVIVPREEISNMRSIQEADDFISDPYNFGELVVRMNRLLNRDRRIRSSDLITSDSLVIDLTRCEVTINENIIELTFKEYELLRLMAVNRGRVFTRETLLNRIWGYDYYGGARTVDTHIRRLRSKTENAQNSFIETVRNVGYRFKKDD